MASSPDVPFKSHSPGRPLGLGEYKRRMQQTTARSDPSDVANYAAVPLPNDKQLALLECSPRFQSRQAAQSVLATPPRLPIADAPPVNHPEAAHPLWQSVWCCFLFS